MMRTEHRIHLKIVFIREDGGWVAQALEHDFAAQGETREEALRALAQTIAGHFLLAGRVGIENPLDDVQAAPALYWQLFERAAQKEVKAQDLDAPGLPPAFAIQAFSDDFCPAF